MTRPLVHLLLAVLVACKQDTGIVQLEPRIAVAPAILDFGDVPSPVEASDVVFVTNNGRAPLELQVDLEGAGAFSYDLDENEVLIGETLAIPVHFRPPTFLEYDGELVFMSNDPESPEVRVPLMGRGIAAPLPDIQISPLTLDFGEVAQGASGTQFLLLRNDGDAALTLGSVVQAGSGAFALQTDPSNGVVGPRTEVPVILTYTPFGDLGDSGTLTFPSDDPDEPELTVVLLGNGGGDYEYPIADIDCPGGSEPPAWVDLDGSGSSDPAGLLPLTYAWTLLDKPEGSQESLTNLVTDTTRLFTDVAGDYEVQLVVTNAAGTVSAPDRCAIAAVPADELHVELSWDTPAADLDLHLARGDAAIFEVGEDCSFCAISPQWGAANPDDDPRLDLDDQGGFGPENINIREPSDAAYTVRVHYWEEHGDDVVTARVRVYSYGLLAWEGTRTMERDEVWDVGLVNWPAGTFGAYSTVNYTSPTRLCF
jgi:hypothetical protein